MDPFARRCGRFAALAAKVGCSEGQLYSMIIGVLLLWVMSANGLPSVVWEPLGAASAPGRSSGAGSNQVASPAAATPSAGLISEPPTPSFSPVTTPSSSFEVWPEPTPSPPLVSNPVPEFVGSGETDDQAGASGPLRIVDAGYASAVAGTPLATIGVPEGSVAVARRAGQPYHVGYLRLEGKGELLELDVDAEGTTTLDALAQLSLCVVKEEDWQVGHGDVTLEEAPAYDCSAAVTGVRSEPGERWTFDVSGLPLQSAAGVALVPSGGGPEFQVVFSRPTTDQAQEVG